MKTFTSTLAIFALLFSTSSFSTVLNENLSQNFNTEVKTSSKSEITPPLMPRKPDPVTNN